MIELALLLIAGHYLADFGLQNDFVAQQKAHALRTAMGTHALTAHSMMHGLVAAVVVGALGHGWLFPAAVVMVSHWLIDFGKTRDFYGINIDQGLHLAVLVTLALSVA